MRSILLSPVLALLLSCSGSAPPPAQTPPPTDEPSSRPELTAAECEAEGGTVVGDIGDGAVHRPDYRCPDSGEAPIGTVVADPDGPVAIEGAVCCR